MDWVALFCGVDDLCREFEPQFRRRLLAGPKRTQNRSCRLSLSEMMTLVIAFHASHYRDFKAFYLYLRRTGADLFPHLAVCGNKRIERNRVFEGLAKRGKSTVGWFYGFKLHLVINDCGELLGVNLTRHRSARGFMVNLLAGLVAYTHQPKKPSIRLQDDEKQLLTINA